MEDSLRSSGVYTGRGKRQNKRGEGGQKWAGQVVVLATWEAENPRLRDKAAVVTTYTNLGVLSNVVSFIRRN